ncbi:MAG: glycoside hydrolase family 2, partial [Oscillospiraceae bacterium]|nr:glycoside hydrolase family 2 [Oscillospiraceae bacterium]
MSERILELCKDTLICDKWEFSKNPIDTEYSDNLQWKCVDIPHDWMIYETRNLYETSTGWYRRKLDWHKEDGIRTAIRFEGVYMDSRVYVNGSLAGEWKYGYSTFEFDITELLNEGENEISVRVDYRSPNSRWYSGAGIYRRVWLRTYPDCHIASDGIYISTDICGDVTVTAEVMRPADVPVSELAVKHTVYDNDTAVCSSQYPCCAYDRSQIPEAVRADSFNYSVNTVTMNVPSPVLWDIDAPHMYTVVTELIRNGETQQSVVTKFGIRKAEFTCDKGFFLNDRHIKLHGCCEHHDLGSLGAAVNKAAIVRKLTKLREMGINSIRTSHNMPAVELMELADEMGFLILSEGFDMWEKHKTDYDYAGFFPEWIGKDVASWVRRDRNHPSLIGWSIGNEIYDTHADERGQEVASMLMGLVRLHDPRANGYVTIGSNYMQWENAQKCADIVKLAGYNYAERLYDEQHKAHPDWMIYGSETASVVQSRGIYHFPLAQ